MKALTIRAAAIVALGAATLAGYHAGAQRTPTQGEETTLEVGEVMRVGDRTITAEDLIARVFDFETALKPDEKVLEPSLSYLRDTTALDLEAERLGVSVTDEEVRQVAEQQLAAIKETIKRDHRGMLPYEQWLQRQGMTKEAFEKYLLERSPVILKKRLVVNYFEQTEPSMVCSHILTRRLADAKRFHKQLEDAKDNDKDVKALFEDIAVAHSEDPNSSINRGRLPRLYENDGTLVKSVAEAAWNLEDEEFSEPVKSGFGYHILMRHETFTPEERPFSEMRDELVKSDDVDEARFGRYVRWVFNTRGYEVERRLPGFDVRPNTQEHIRPPEADDESDEAGK